MRYTKRQLLHSLDTFSRAYLQTALWSSTDESTPSGGNPLDRTCGVEDFTHAALLASVADCKRFQAENVELLGHEEVRLDVAGHDFWLTRNRHGAGFWDGGYPMTGEALTRASWRYPQVDLYLHRGRVYHT